MPFTNAVDQAFLDYFLTTYDLHAGYSTADPTKDGTGVAEPAGGTGYARVDIDAVVTRTGSEIDNDAVIEFPEATSAQGHITHACLFDGAGGIIWYGELTAHKDVGVGDTPRFPAGDFNITQS